MRICRMQSNGMLTSIFRFDRGSALSSAESREILAVAKVNWNCAYGWSYEMSFAFYWIKVDLLLCNTVELSLKPIELNAILHQSAVRKIKSNWRRILQSLCHWFFFASDYEVFVFHSISLNKTSNRICRELIALSSVLCNTLVQHNLI